MKDFDKELKQELNLDVTQPIPADYNIPYFVHADDMNKMDMSHKRIEKWILAFAIVIFIAFVGTNVYWLWNESQYEDIVITQENADGYNNYIGNDGDITN